MPAHDPSPAARLDFLRKVHLDDAGRKVTLCFSCWVQTGARRVMDSPRSTAYLEGWALWQGTREGASAWICHVCWFSEDYDTLLARMGSPAKEYLAGHPGPLPPELRHLCIPQGHEYCRVYDSVEDFKAGRRARVDAGADKDIWATHPELLRVKEVTMGRVLRRQAKDAKVAKAAADAPRTRAPRTTSAIAQAYPCVTVERELGRGAFSTVFSVVHDDGRRCALKVLTPECLADAQIRRRFEPNCGSPPPG